ncbi:Vhr1-domain-containing protein, partial [Suhomyces tanzawaensis NRRL Y-17324]
LKESKRMGVTNAIRNKLNFLDERLWKRFSARRLELIDTLDLSSRKASEQDADIKMVAEALRVEFGYNEDFELDFDKLVRAAVQSVRRNRKRSSKTKHEDEEPPKRHKPGPEQLPEPKGSPKTVVDATKGGDTTTHRNFLAEISKIDSDGNDEIYDLNYSRTKHFSTEDRAKAAIDSMIRPRLQAPPQLPPLQLLATASEIPDATGAKTTLINHIERSKSCLESVSKKSENIQALGRSIMSSSIAYVFEKSFENVNEVSIEYLRNKLNHEVFLARFFRELDPEATTQVSDEIAVISLYTLLGGCVKDFGFEVVMFPLCELLYVLVLRDYPLIAKNSTAFRSADYLRPHGESVYGGNNSLSSLAAVATDIQMREQRPGGAKMTSAMKQVLLKFLSSVLEFSYGTNNLAPPRLMELLENARSAFKLTSANDSILGVRNIKDGLIVRTDLDLERIFKHQEKIELEIFSQRSKAIPIYEITSTVIPNYNERSPAGDGPKIVLPPPLQRVALAHPRLDGGDKSGLPFLSNNDEAAMVAVVPSTPPVPPPPPLLPRFQPLL